MYINMYINKFLNMRAHIISEILFFSLPIKWNFQIEINQVFGHWAYLEWGVLCSHSLLPSSWAETSPLFHNEALSHSSNPACPLFPKFLLCIRAAHSDWFINIRCLKLLNATSFCSIQTVKILPTYLNLAYLPLEIRTKSITLENSC